MDSVTSIASASFFAAALMGVIGPLGGAQTKVDGSSILNLFVSLPPAVRPSPRAGESDRSDGAPLVVHSPLVRPLPAGTRGWSGLYFDTPSRGASRP
jgi:hypothetical protein